MSALRHAGFWAVGVMPARVCKCSSVCFLLRVFFCLTDRNHIVPALMGMPACSGLSG